jgi:hypothetical protein
LEVLALKERNKYLETRLTLAVVNFEELEIKKEILLTKISEHENEIENLLKNEKRISEEVKVLQKKMTI